MNFGTQAFLKTAVKIVPSSQKDTHMQHVHSYEQKTRQKRDIVLKKEEFCFPKSHCNITPKALFYPEIQSGGMD